MAKKIQSAYLIFEETQLHFDCVLTENSEDISTLTEHAVESGANVSDHIRSENPRITLDLFISNSPIRDVNGTIGLQVDSVELKVPKPPARIPFTPGAAMSAGISAIGSLLSPPDPWKAQILRAPGPFNNIQMVESQLLEWKDAGEMGEVVTPHRLYKDMVITRVAKTRTKDTGNGANITVELRGVRLVEVKAITAPVPTETRGKIMVAKGRQGNTAVGPAQAEKVKSWAKFTADKGRSRFGR